MLGGIVDKFIIIDGNSLANRAFYAMPYLSNRKKQPSGAVFGFANLLTKLIAEQRPKYIAVAFDHARKTFRNEIYAEYKGTRKETSPDLIFQFDVIKQMLVDMGIKTFEYAGIEADDIIGTLSKKSGVKNILVTGDRDLLQLVSDTSQVWLTRRGVTDVEVFDEVALFEKFGLKPSGIIDLKALMGDASDNIPGVAGVGEKTALSLLDKYKDLDNVYANIEHVTGKLKDNLLNCKDNAYMSKLLATIKIDCDIDFSLEDCRYDFPFSQKVRDFFEDWDFRTLISRKEIFAEGVTSKHNQKEGVLLENIQMVEEFTKIINSYFAYDIKDLKFYSGGDKYFYLKKEIDLFSETLDISEVLQIFKPVFENPNICKITNSSKEDIKILSNYHIKLENYFDIDIASYMLFAGLTKNEKPDISDYFRLKNEYQAEMSKMGVDKLYYEVELPLVDVLVSMEQEGFRVDETVLDGLADKYNEMLRSITDKIYELAGERFNINSPKQVADVLFDKLQLKAFNNKKRSTNSEVLEDIKWQHEIVDYIIQFRKVSKLLSTYINVYQTICKNSGNVVHTIFNQTLTSTGRLSSSEPNMQNIPTRDEEGKNLRKIFISKYEDGEIISADYSQIELRLLANMAEEKEMIEAYKNGIDIHTKTASEIFGVPIENVSSSQRRDAKAVNFGIIYGISDFGLSQNIKTSVNQAKKYIENYFDKYPKIKLFMNRNIDFAKENEYIKSYFGRIRHIPEIQSSNINVRKFGERVAMNMPLQGTASDIIKMAMVEVFKKMKGMKSHLILQVHDELIIDAPKEEVQSMKALLRDCMENVCHFAVPLTVSVESGKNLFECK